jgi:hypothetical protein
MERDLVGVESPLSLPSLADGSRFLLSPSLEERSGDMARGEGGALVRDMPLAEEEPGIARAGEPTMFDDEDWPRPPEGSAGVGGGAEDGMEVEVVRDKPI